MKEAINQVYVRYGSPLAIVFGPVVAPRTYLRALHLPLMRIGSHADRRRRDDLDDRRASGAHRGPLSLTLVRRRRGLDGSPRY